MLVMVGAIETSIAGAGERFLGEVGYSWSLTARAAREQAPGCGVLVLGDSQAKFGLSPRVLSEVTGQRSYNLAMPAAAAPAIEAVLRRALDAGARPSAVVLDLKGGLLIGGPNYSLGLLPHCFSASDALRLIARERKVSFASELLLRMALPSYRSRFDLRAALRDESGKSREQNALVRRQAAVNDGAYLAMPALGPRTGVTEAEHKAFTTHGFYADPVNATYARALIAMAAAHGARTYLLLPPAYPELLRRRVQTGAEAKYLGFIRSLQDDHPGLTVLDARESGYHEGLFIDRLHLDALAAVALSEGVATVLRRDLDAPGSSPPKRWVRLPDYRERPLPGWLEHNEMSRARIAAEVRE
jgi:hypothetical protein